MEADEQWSAAIMGVSQSVELGHDQQRNNRYVASLGELLQEIR